MNQKKSNKKTAVQIAISTVIFMEAFLVFPLGAEKIISPLILPVVLFIMASIVFSTMFG